MVKNRDAREIRNGKLVNVYWKILEYNTVVLEDNTGSLEARRGKNMVWQDKEVRLVIFW